MDRKTEWDDEYPLDDLEIESDEVHKIDDQSGTGPINPIDLAQEAGWSEEAFDEPTPPKKRSPLERMPAKRSLIPVLVFLSLALGLSWLSWIGVVGNLSVSRNLLFVQKEYWRAFAALFAHADIAHFLANSWLIVIFGWYLHDFGGLQAFPIHPMILGALANVGTVYFYPPDMMLLGASGMSYAMVGLWLMIYMKNSPLGIGKKLLHATGFILAVMMPHTFEKDVSYLAHFLGMILGFGLGLLYPRKKVLEPV